MRHRPLESASEPSRLPCHPEVPSCHSEVRRGIPTSARAARSTQIHFRTTPPPLSFRGPPRNLAFRPCRIVHSDPLKKHPAPTAIPKSPPVIPRSAEESRLPLPRHRELRSDREARRSGCHSEVRRGISTSAPAPSSTPIRFRSTPPPLSSRGPPRDPDFRSCPIASSISPSDHPTRPRDIPRPPREPNFRATHPQRVSSRGLPVQTGHSPAPPVIPRLPRSLPKGISPSSPYRPRPACVRASS